MLFGLSTERNLTGFDLLGGFDAAIPPVVTEKTASESSSANMPKNLEAAADNLIDLQLQPAESPSWRVLETLLKLC